MSFPNSPGVYPRTIDKSYIVPSTNSSIGGIVIHSHKGPSGVPTLVTSNQEFLNVFGNPVPEDISKYAALAFLQRSNRLVVVRVINDATAASATAMDTATTPAATFAINAIDEGAWGDNVTVTFNDPVTTDSKFNLIVSYNGTQVETWTVSKSQLLKDGFGRSLYIEDVINGNSSYINIADDTTNTNDPDMTQSLSLTGGTDDTTLPTDTQVSAAWSLFDNTNNVEVDLLINGGWDTPVVQTQMISVAETRKDCFAILEVPSNTTSVANIKDYVTTTLNANTSWAAIYAGWVKDYDQFNDKTFYMPSSGYVGAVYAYTASQSEVWIPPAGSRRGMLNVLGVNAVFSEGDRDTLYEAGINPIQQFPGDGIQVYGQKTLQQEPSALDRVNVRLLTIQLQKALKRSFRSFVFEVNDTFTRENISSIVNSYMDGIKTRRGVYDYLVVCDSSNNTAQVIDNEELIVDLYIKPTRAAEFIRLNTVITNTGASFKQIQ